MNRPLIIFDFDGTIANSFEIGIKYANSLAPKFGYKPVKSIDEVREESAVSFIFKRVKWYQIPRWSFLMKRYVKKNSDKIPLYEGIEPVIKELSKKFDLGIIGGGQTEYISNILNKYQINLFSFIYGNTGIRKHKKIKKLKKEYSSIVLIGDDTVDIKAAKKSNIPVISVTWGSSSEPLLSSFNPDIIVNSPSEIIASVNKLIY